jgi:ABC-type glycerol-3-phosphate transport system permease component
MKRAFRRQFVLLTGMALFTLVNLIPIIWGFMISIRQPGDAFAIPPKLIFEPTLIFHYQVWVERGFVNFLLNSLIIAAGTIAISVPIGTLAAYGLARTKSRHSGTLLFGLLAVRMFPQILLAIPFFVMARWLNMVDSYWMMILSMVAINQPFTIWLMRSFFVDVPIELDEAAMIDGCNRWQAFFLIVLPAVRPGLAVTSLFSALLAYNEFLFALILTGSRTKTLPVAIAEYGGEDISYWSLSAAGAIGIMLPVVLFTIAVQRNLIRGLTFGAVKG